MAGGILNADKVMFGSDFPIPHAHGEIRTGSTRINGKAGPVIEREPGANSWRTIPAPPP